MTITPSLRTAAVVLTAALACAACTPSRNDAETKAAIAELETAVAAAKAEVQRLKDIDELENLAGIYGHYVDKSRHDDVADLFAPNGVVEILGRGVYHRPGPCASIHAQSHAGQRGPARRLAVQSHAPAADHRHRTRRQDCLRTIDGCS